jgi:hypothetical protein
MASIECSMFSEGVHPLLFTINSREAVAGWWPAGMMRTKPHSAALLCCARAPHTSLRSRCRRIALAWARDSFLSLSAAYQPPNAERRTHQRPRQGLYGRGGAIRPRGHASLRHEPTMARGAAACNKFSRTASLPPACRGEVWLQDRSLWSALPLLGV